MRVKKSKRKADAASAQPSLDTGAVSTAELESIVFGGNLGFRDPDKTAAEEGVEAAQAESEPEAEAQASEAEEGSKKKRVVKTTNGTGSSGGPAWVDSDDDTDRPKRAWVDGNDAELEVDLLAQSRTVKLRRTNTEMKVAGDEYERRLREQFHKINGRVTWADARRPADDDDSDAEFASEVPNSANPLAKQGSGALAPVEIDMKRLRDVDYSGTGDTTRGPAVVRVMQFHPNSELLLAGGLDKTLRLFSVDGEENPKIASYFFKKFPIYGASFTSDGAEVFLVGPNHVMKGLDVASGEPFEMQFLVGSQHHEKYHFLTMGPCPKDNPGLKISKLFGVVGDSGATLLCDIRMRQPVRTLRMSCPGAALAFHPERDALYSADSEANIYEWDVGTGRCRQKVRDPWAIKITSLSVSRASAFAPKPILAVGTGTGNIDFYDASSPSLSKEPMRTNDNLTTSVTNMCFHSKGEVLATASRYTQDHLKLVHMGTGKVYRNWPTERTPLNAVSAMDFTRTGGILAVGNEKGRILLWRLQHYEKA